MKIIKLNPKAGYAKLLINSLDDLWHLSKIIEKGDLASARTTRKIKLGGDAERAKVIKKSFYIKIEVDKVELGHELKLHGRTVEEKENIAKGSVHSLSIAPGMDLKIEKAKWMKYQVDRLREAEKSSLVPKVLLCVLDDEQASFAHLTASGVKSAGSMKLRLSRKKEKEAREKKASVDSLIKILKEKGEGVEHIVLASPIIWKDIVLKELKSKAPELAKKILLENVSTGSKRGIHELISEGKLNKIISESRVARETQLVEKLLGEIAKGGKVIYGIDEVQSNIAAIRVLLVSDTFLEIHKEEVSQIIDAIEASKGEVHIIDSKNEAGKKLDSLGGIGGLLRY